MRILIGAVALYLVLTGGTERSRISGVEAFHLPESSSAMRLHRLFQSMIPSTTLTRRGPVCRQRCSPWLARYMCATDNDKSMDASTAATAVAAASDETSSSLNDVLAPYRNRNNIRDQVVSALSGGGGIKVTAATVRNIMNDMMLQHSMTEVSAEALGRTVVCSLLMANGIQQEQIVQISIKSEGPIRGIVAMCTGSGEVRGYVGSPMLGGGLSLEDAVGRTGAVQIVKNHPDWPRPYNGITAIRHGDIDQDIGIYLAESEQRSCALAAAMSVTGFLCKAAGGYLIEQLPGATDHEKDKVSENLAKLVELDGGEKLPTNLLLSGRSPIDIAEILLDGLDMQPLQQIDPVLKCDCTEDRLVRSLRLLPASDVDDILEKQERVEARCEFCGTVYRLEAEQVREKLARKVDDAE
jgi:molecular chaperone Hsp33